MKQLIDEFNKVYPQYAAREVVDSTFDESENAGKDKTLRNLTIYKTNAFVIPNIIASDANSFYNKAKSPNILEKVCDGIFLKKEADRKFIYICELKSSFIADNIVKAKDQVVGSYLKLHSLLSLLQSYKQSEWTVRGIIALFTPPAEKVQDFLRKKSTGDKVSSFCYDFQRDKKYVMPEDKCKKYFSPLNVPEITLYHVSVPGMPDSYTIDFSKIII